MENPSIFLFGIRIDEPVTSITDILVTVVCWYAWGRLRKIESPLPELFYFRWFFLLMGLATLLGGVLGHAFQYAISFEWKLPGWLISMISITVLERAVIFHSRSILKASTVRFFFWFNIVELLVFAFLAFSQLDFRFVEYHSAYGLLVVVFGFCLHNWIRGYRPDFVRQMMVGVVLSVLAALIFINKIAVSEWLTHADISHVLMAGTAVYFYRGARLLFEKAGSSVVMEKADLRRSHKTYRKTGSAKSAGKV